MPSPWACPHESSDTEIGARPRTRLPPGPSTAPASRVPRLESSHHLSPSPSRWITHMSKNPRSRTGRLLGSRSVHRLDAARRRRRVSPRVEWLDDRVLLSVNSIVAENQLPGTPPSQWQIVGGGDTSI